MIDALRVKTPSDSQVVQYLSGGNQQKVVLGKWLALKPRVLLLDEPADPVEPRRAASAHGWVRGVITHAGGGIAARAGSGAYGTNWKEYRSASRRTKRMS